MKKAWLLLSLLVMIGLFVVPAVSAGTTSVSVAKEAIIDDQITLVPVEISDNPGFLSFKINCRYDSELIEIENIIPGNVTSKGTLFNNLGLHPNEVDVAWYDVSDHNDDGILFVFAIKAKDSFTQGNNTEITLDYSQEDTFNSEFKDVILSCNTIVVKSGIVPSSISFTDVDASNNNEISNEQIISVVDVAKINSNLKSINEADEKVLSDINQDLQIVTGIKTIGFSSVEEMKTAYKSSLIEKFSQKLESDYGKELSTKAATILNYEVKSFDELSDHEKITVIKELISDEDDDFESLVEIADSNDKTEDGIKHKNTDDQASIDENPSLKNNKYTWIIVICVIGVMIVVILFFVRKRIKAS